MYIAITVDKLQFERFLYMYLLFAIMFAVFADGERILFTV